MNILVVNLTRFGDLLQSQAALDGLAGLAARPGRANKIGLVCLQNFAGAAGLLRRADYLAPLPGSLLLSKLESAWPEALAGLEVWSARVRREFAPDLVCNLTPSIAARLLGRHLAGDSQLSGFGLDAFGFGTQGNSWGAFMQAAGKSRQVSPFNVVDLFRAVAGVHSLPAQSALAGPAPQAVEEARQRLESLAPPGHQGFVAFQPGASEDRRRWPLEYFATVGERLWQELRLCPVILGVKSEEPLALEYAGLAAKTPHINLCGATNLAQLAATLKTCRLLLTNDTGTMHLAAGLGTAILAIFLATAQPWDTGPYLAGSCSAEPDLDCHPCAFGVKCPRDLACRHSITPDTVFRQIRVSLDSGNWLSMPAQEAKARLWLAAPDEHGFMGLKSISGHAGSPRTVWLTEQRYFLRRFFDRDQDAEFVFLPQSFPLALPAEEAAALQKELEQTGSFMQLLLEQGRLLGQNPLPRMKDKFMATWQRVAAGLESSRHLAALALLWREETLTREADFGKILKIVGQYKNLLDGLRRRAANPAE